MQKKNLNKINHKSIGRSGENIAEQNASIAIGGGAYIAYWLLLALGLVLIAGSVNRWGCSCSCRCASTRNTMLAAAGYGNHAVAMAKR